MISSLRMIQQLQQVDNTSGDFFIGLTKFGLGIYTGSLTMTLGSISELLNNAEKSTAPVQTEIYKYLVSLQRFQDAKRLLPKVSKTLADDPSANEEFVNIDITEPWGVSDFTYFKIENRSTKDLECCTLSIILHAKESDDKVQNVYFYDSWPREKVITHQYNQGVEAFGKTIGRTTVPNIKNAEVSFYCDELSSKNIVYQYAEAEKKKDIEEYMKRIKLTMRYQPFREIDWWPDQERALILSFEGLDYLPKHSIEVIAKNENLQVTKTVSIDNWPAQKEQKVEFPNISWNPSDWIITLHFINPEIVRKYTWKTTY
jgi:hypothetical protein